VLSDRRIPSAKRLESYRLRSCVRRIVDDAIELVRDDSVDETTRARARAFTRTYAIDRYDAGFTYEEVRLELECLAMLVVPFASDAIEESRLRLAIDDAMRIVEEIYATERAT